MKWVGKSVAKIDGVAIATGKPLYTEDLTVPGTLTVKLLRSPHAFARIRSIDTAAAKALEGVECVLTYQDVPQVRLCSGVREFPRRLLFGALIYPAHTWTRGFRGAPRDSSGVQEALARKGLLPSCQTKGVHHGARATARCW